MSHIFRVIFTITVFTINGLFAASDSSSPTVVCNFDHVGDSDGKRTAWLVVVPEPNEPLMARDCGVILSNDATAKDAVAEVAKLLPGQNFELFALHQKDPKNPTCNLEECYINLAQGPLSSLVGANPKTGLYVLTEARRKAFANKK